MSGAICNGIESERRIVWRCPKCRCRRSTTVYQRYDSSILLCSQGHEWVTGDPDGLHYAGRFNRPRPVRRKGAR